MDARFMPVENVIIPRTWFYPSQILTNGCKLDINNYYYMQFTIHNDLNFSNIILSNTIGE